MQAEALKTIGSLKEDSSAQKCLAETSCKAKISDDHPAFSAAQMDHISRTSLMSLLQRMVSLHIDANNALHAWWKADSHTFEVGKIFDPALERCFVALHDSLGKFDAMLPFLETDKLLACGSIEQLAESFEFDIDSAPQEVDLFSMFYKYSQHAKMFSNCGHALLQGLHAAAVVHAKAVLVKKMEEVTSKFPTDYIDWAVPRTRDMEAVTTRILKNKKHKFLNGCRDASQMALTEISGSKVWLPCFQRDVAIALKPVYNRTNEIYTSSEMFIGVAGILRVIAKNGKLNQKELDTEKEDCITALTEMNNLINKVPADLFTEMDSLMPATLGMPGETKAKKKGPNKPAKVPAAAAEASSSSSARPAGAPAATAAEAAAAAAEARARAAALEAGGAGLETPLPSGMAPSTPL